MTKRKIILQPLALWALPFCEGRVAKRGQIPFRPSGTLPSLLPLLLGRAGVGSEGLDNSQIIVMYCGFKDQY
ncbi:hypothetical protein D0T84_13350 [Dysgonomonas sp. 521]|nr:hypothetical protein [Dysgonomonas sp. 521]